MKTLFFALLMTASVVQASSWVAHNKAGGEIILSDAKCTSKEYPFLATVTAPRQTAYGCWRLEKDAIQVLWTDTDGAQVKRSYPADIFEEIETI